MKGPVHGAVQELRMARVEGESKEMNLMVIRCIHLILLITSMLFMLAGVVFGADTIEFTASQPYVMYYTTSGASVAEPISESTSSINSNSGLSDFVASASTSTVTWTGGGLDSLASNPANWSGNSAPLNSDAIIFDGTSSKDAIWDYSVYLALLNINEGYSGEVFVSWPLSVSENITIAGGIVTINNVILITPATTYTVTATAGGNGSISPSGSTTVDFGSSQAFTITPNTGYHVVDVTVDDIPQGAITTYTFSNVAANHTITATFALDTFTITATAGGYGGVSPTGATTVNYGASQNFSITSNSGYAITDVIVDGISQGILTAYTFTNVTANHTISATFATGYYIMVTAGSGGIVTPATSVVSPGASQTYTITPNTGYDIAGVVVDGVPQGLITSYIFNNVAAGHAISATFKTSAQSPPTSSPNYFYDELGRLARVVQGASGVIYGYDELGNLLETTNATSAGGSPVIIGISPDVLFTGSSIPVTITGQSLLATESITANNGLVTIKNISISDTSITAEMTALSSGAETISLTTREG